MTHTKPLLGIVLEERFRQLPDGRIFSPSGFSDAFWQRYLAVFSHLAVIARIEAANEVEGEWVEICDPRVSFRAIRPFLGPVQFLMRFFSVRRSFCTALEGINGLIVRAPGTLSLLALHETQKDKRPYAVELVGDPTDVFGAGIGGRLSKALAVIFRRATVKLCAEAYGVSYVTQTTLQARYPARSGAVTIGCSSVEIPEELISSASKVYPFTEWASPPVLFCAASLEVPYKGIDVLIQAIKHIKSKGMFVRLRVAGDGRLKADLQILAEKLDVSDQVSFLGRLDHDTIFSEMSKCDLYVQPSLTEGLPRAVIEACAVSAPIVASRVGGIPELLLESCMVPPGDMGALAEKIHSTLSNPAQLEHMSIQNLSVAQDYGAERLNIRRRSFYKVFFRHITADGNT